MRQGGKAENPYPYRSIPWALMEEDWSDLTANQIAEVFGEEVEPRAIRRYIASIKHRTGYVVPFKRCAAGRKRKLVDPLQFEMSIQAEDLSSYVPSFGWELGPPSDAQRASLEKRLCC